MENTKSPENHQGGNNYAIFTESPEQSLETIKKYHHQGLVAFQTIVAFKLNENPKMSLRSFADFLRSSTGSFVEIFQLSVPEKPRRNPMQPKEKNNANSTNTLPRKASGSVHSSKSDITDVSTENS